MTSFKDRFSLGNLFLYFLTHDLFHTIVRIVSNCLPLNELSPYQYFINENRNWDIAVLDDSRASPVRTAHAFFGEFSIFVFFAKSTKMQVTRTFCFEMHCIV